jgi:hypothetical protein
LIQTTRVQIRWLMWAKVAKTSYLLLRQLREVLVKTNQVVLGQLGLGAG